MGNGVGFWELQAFLQWHTSSSKRTPPPTMSHLVQSNHLINWETNIELCIILWESFSFKSPQWLQTLWFFFKELRKLATVEDKYWRLLLVFNERHWVTICPWNQFIEKCVYLYKFYLFLQCAKFPLWFISSTWYLGHPWTPKLVPSHHLPLHLSFPTEIREQIKYSLLWQGGITALYCHSQLINLKTLLTKKIPSNEVSLDCTEKQKVWKFSLLPMFIKLLHCN